MCVCVCVCVLGGVVTVNVIDVCQVNVQPPARSVPVNCPTITRVVTAGAGCDAELKVNVKCTSIRNKHKHKHTLTPTSLCLYSSC